MIAPCLSKTISMRRCKTRHNMQRCGVSTTAMQPGVFKLTAKRLYIAVGLLLLAIAVFLAWQIGPAEPVYEGKPLNRWLEGHTASSLANPPYPRYGSAEWKKADEI